MIIHYTQLREDLGAGGQETCDNYKYDVHPMTGKITLTLLEVQGASTYVKHVVTGVVGFWVDRQR